MALRAVKTTVPLFFNAEDDSIKIFIPPDEDGQREALASCLPKEIIRFIGLPEGESWQLVTALLAVPIDRVKTVLTRFGVQNSLPDYLSSTDLDLDGSQTENAPLDGESVPDIFTDVKFSTQKMPVSPSIHGTTQDAEPRKKFSMKIFSGGLSPSTTSTATDRKSVV